MDVVACRKTEISLSANGFRLGALPKVSRQTGQDLTLSSQSEQIGWPKKRKKYLSEYYLNEKMWWFKSWPQKFGFIFHLILTLNLTVQVIICFSFFHSSFFGMSSYSVTQKQMFFAAFSENLKLMRWSKGHSPYHVNYCMSRK